MGIKARDSVKTIQGYVNSPAEILNLFGGQISELALNVSEFVENQRRSPRRESFIPLVESMPVISDGDG